MEQSDTETGLARHLDSRFDLGTRALPATPYRPNYPFPGQYINAQHAAYAAAPRNRNLVDLGIAGWLRVEDALKLYELAYFSTGDILELGTSRGLSTSILAQGLKDAGKGFMLTTVDIDPACVADAKAALTKRGLDDMVEFLCGDAGQFLDFFRSEGREFSFAFVDHSHAYEPMLKACRALDALLLPRSFVLFHDYADRRNTERQDIGESGKEYGVVAAIQDALPQDLFDFYGCYGCCGLFLRQ